MRRLAPILLATLAIALPVTVAAAPPASASTPSLAGESLAGTDVLTGACPPPGDAGNVPYTATGAATGPYPGTFTESGYWELDLLVLSIYHSTFTITSGSTTITGSADSTGPAFASCDGRAYTVPTHYAAQITGSGTSSAVSGSSTVDIIYGQFTHTFAGGNPGGGPTITTTSLPSATRGQPYSKQLAATGGTTPYSWKRIGTLPKGLSLSSTGLLSGTPRVTDAAGPYPFSVKVTTAQAPGHPSQSATQALSLTLA